MILMFLLKVVLSYILVKDYDGWKNLSILISKAYLIIRLMEKNL